MENQQNILENEPKVKRYTETVEKEIFETKIETKTHIFKINSDKLEAMEEKKNFLTKISSIIQKGMKQTVDKSSGLDWEDSYSNILHEITGQWTLEVENGKRTFN
jgi:hypothetical protein